MNVTLLVVLSNLLLQTSPPTRWTVSLILVIIVIVNVIIAIIAVFAAFRQIDKNLRSMESVKDEALQKSDERFRGIFAESPISIEVYSAEGRLIDANQACLDLFGSTLDNLRGHKLFGDPNLPKEAEEKILRGESTNYEFIFDFGKVREHHLYETTKTGQRHFKAFITPLGQESGNITGYVIQSLDITETKQLEIEERKTALLTIELAKEQELVSLKERLISTISHEFRTPLTIIQNARDLLVNHADALKPAQRTRLMQQITDQIVNLTALIDSALKFNQTQSNQIEYTPVHIDIEAFCKDIIEQTHLVYDGHRDIKFVSQSPGVRVFADANMLAQILNNLLSNAIKYSPGHEPITLTLSHDADVVILEIADQGIGIPQADQPRLFEPFHRASNVGTIQGTGIGLAVVREYVGILSGEITVTSEEGKGTTFRVTLPINRDVEHADSHKIPE